MKMHLDQFQASESVTLRIEGRDLEGFVWFRRPGDPIERRTALPKRALPDCVQCDKPDLWPENYETVEFYELVCDQQTIDTFGGNFLGLRAEAVVPMLDWCVRQGRINDPDVVMRRIWHLDRVVTKIRNDRSRSRREQDRHE